MTVWVSVTALPKASAGSSVSGNPATVQVASPAGTFGTQLFADATNTGPRFSSLHTLAGLSAHTTSDLPAWTTGSGTLGDPYVIARTTFTADCQCSGYSSDPSDWAGKYVEFQDCIFYGEPGNPTPNTSFAFGTRTDTDVNPARITAKYCRMGPNATPVAGGGPPTGTGGFNAAVWSQCPITLDHCDIWGAAINVQFVNSGASAPMNNITNCWLHDSWCGTGDHTDNINGADPTNASNVLVQNCTIDGKCGQRTPTDRVVNGFGIYNTQPITNWTIDTCKILNADFGIFWAPAGTGGAITNMTIKNCVFDLTNLGTAFSGSTTPLTQSNNKDQNGNPLTF